MAAWAISVKGVFGPPGSVVLLHNERDEWELPGGRLEPDDASLTDCLRREVAEELGLQVDVEDRPLRAWRYRPIPDREVLIVSYRCRLVGPWPDQLGHSDEHDGVGVFGDGELAGLRLPDGYREDIALAAVRG